MTPSPGFSSAAGSTTPTTRAPRALPVLGHLAAYMVDPLGFLQALASATDAVAHFKLGRRDAYLVHDPVLVRQVLLDREQVLVRAEDFQQVSRLLGESSLTTEGGVHQTHRGIVQRTFPRAAAPGQAAVAVGYAVDLSRGWDDGLVIDAMSVMSQLSLRVIARLVLGVDIRQAGAPMEIGRAAAISIQVQRDTMRSRSPRRWLPPALWRFGRGHRARVALELGIASLVQRRRAAPEPAADLLATLVAAESAGELNAVGVRDEIVTFLMAGHETVATALAWAWYLLALHPAAEARLHAELDGLLEGRPPTADDLTRLPWTRAVLAETLRLYPPLWAVSRRANRTHALGGITVLAGALVLVSAYVTQRDPRRFSAPGQFVPERWLDGSVLASEPGFFPFGGGRHRCVGESLAWSEGMMILATLAQHWRLRLEPGQRVTPEAGVTLRPLGKVRMQIRRRTPSPGGQP